MKILLVEDDSIQAALIAERLIDEFSDFADGCLIQKIATESGFRNLFESIAKMPPDLIVMDLMLRWCDVAEDMPERPQEFEDFSRAGVRCCKLLRADLRTKRIPVVVLTVLDKNGLGLPEGCEHVQKSSDFAQLTSQARRQINK